MNRHESQRGYFAHALYEQMKSDNHIYLLVADLGYRVFDQHFIDFPDRCFNVGAAEQTMLDIAVGLAYEGKIPVCYSITPFLLYRGFETIRTYIDHENLNVKLVGSGRGSDYVHDGFSHYAGDDFMFMQHFMCIDRYTPDDKEVIPGLVQAIMESKSPCYLNLKR